MSRWLPGVLTAFVLSRAPMAAAQDHEAGDDIKALAVMYFEDRGGGEEWQWLSTGLADMLITDLGRSERLLVVERERLSAVLQELRLVTGGLIDPPNAAQVGKITEVDWVLFGSFLVEGGHLTVEGHILEVKSGELLRVEQVEGKAEDVLALEKRLAEGLLSRLDVPLTDGERELLNRTPTDSVDALTHYYRGIEAYESGDYHRALAEFRLAARQDPGYIEAGARLASLYQDIGEARHSLVEYYRLTQGDSDKTLPDWVYYGMGQVLESDLQDYQGAIDAYSTITDRRPEFRFTGDDVERGLEECERRRETVPSWSKDRPLAQAKRLWLQMKTACRALERIAVCHERLGDWGGGARHYLRLTAFFDMHGMSGAGGVDWADLRERVRKKALTLYAEAVLQNRDYELPLALHIIGMPTTLLKVERPLGGGARIVAPQGQEIRSLLITTWPLSPRPPEGFVEGRYGRQPPRPIGFHVSDYADKQTLCSLRYPPYEGMKRLPSYPPHYDNFFRETHILSEFGSVSETEQTEEGCRTHKVDLPPGFRGVRVSAMNAGMRCEITSKPWSGPQPRPGVWVRDWANLTITIDPEPASRMYYDGKLWPWPPGRPLTSHGQHIREPGKHHLRVVWPNGRSDEAEFDAVPGEDVHLLMTPDHRVLETHPIAEKGSYPYILRDRRGLYWLFWDEALSKPDWQHSERDQTSDIYFSTSANGGTWRNPQRAAISSLDLDMHPILQQDSRGIYWLAWYSDRDASNPGSLWLASSSDGLRWSYPRRIRLKWDDRGAEDAWFQRLVPQFAFLVDSNDTFWLMWQNRIVRSVDGVNWTVPELVSARRKSGSGKHDHTSLTPHLGQAAAGRLLLVTPRSAPGWDNVGLFASPDGKQWAEKQVLGVGAWGSLSCDSNGRLLAVTGGGRAVRVRASADGLAWSDPSMIEPHYRKPWHPVVAPLGTEQCLVAFSSNEGLTVLRCKLPGATTDQGLPASIRAITGPIEPGPMEELAQPTILILPFQGGEGTELAPLGEALAEVLTIDLARQEGVSVVDRSHLDQVLQEQGLTLTGLTDPAAQVKVGSLLGAKLLLAGSFGLVEGKLAVTANLFDVSTTQLVKSERAEGEVSEWLEVEKELALALVKDLDVELDEVQVRAIDEKPEVNLHFIRGLGYYYANRFDEAIMEFLNTLYGDEKYVDARYWMARSYLATDEPDHARIELERIVTEYPEHRLAATSRELLGGVLASDQRASQTETTSDVVVE